MKLPLLLAFCILTQVSFAEEIKGVHLESSKKGDVRTYRGTISRTLPYSLEAVKKGILNFEEKCNNSHKDRRKYTDKKVDCKYHNDHLVETIVLKDLKPTAPAKGQGEMDRFLLGRQIYNRGAFGHYELIQVFESKDSTKIVQTMLEDKEVDSYVDRAFDKDSAFKKTIATFNLTGVSKSETRIDYEYLAETDHWLLNKEVSVSQVYGSISKSINDLMESIVKEAALKK